MYTEKQLYANMDEVFFRNSGDIIAQLKAYKNLIKYNIENKKQIEANYAVGADLSLLPKIVELENQKNSRLNLYIAKSPNELIQKIIELRNKNETSARFIVGTGNNDLTHFIALDYRKLEGNPSLIGIESATIISSDERGNVPSMLINDIKLLLKTNNLNIPLIVISSDVQKSMGECIIFSIFFCKKMFKHSIYLNNLRKSEKFMRNDFIQDGFTPTASSNIFFPPEFMKHTQSKSRLNDYLSRLEKFKYLDMNTLKVNNKGDKLMEYFNRHKIVGEVRSQNPENKCQQKNYSNSIEIKRQKIINSVLDAYNTREDFFDKK
ncbi:YopJ family acetyltransferase [Xenorhabdus sp. XENO-10]|uniref:YopJ family acetyltransferase n=1 Tax=Xenorhabdus yunnanensis TaxID=3025878 RepID=A0ABT5LGK5_9GAMM|nr:YopJ family acetyltransferase [Xenorhabdus yunnanensis]MDC9590243.1 YopJ family acetyltransferase [Xenorhabdus yunnanensis]